MANSNRRAGRARRLMAQVSARVKAHSPVERVLLDRNLQDLLTRVDIVEVIDRHVSLRNRGANYYLLPSIAKARALRVGQPDKAVLSLLRLRYFGSAIGFLMEYSGLSYVETIRVARQIGVEVPEERNTTAATSQRPIAHR